MRGEAYDRDTRRAGLEPVAAAERQPYVPSQARSPAAAAAPAPPPPGLARRLQPLTIEALPPIPRESVTLWRTLARTLPSYLRSRGVSEAVRAFLTELLAPQQAQRQQITLAVRRAEQPVQQHAFPLGEITIGTHASCTLQLTGAAVSRRHARLVYDERGWSLVDMGSRNGTFLRGERLQPGYAYPLRNGDTFSLPGHEITVRWQQPQPLPVLEDLGVAALRFERRERLLGGVPACGLLALVRREPGGERLVLEIDLPLAQLLVARVLDQPLPPEGGRVGAALQPLTEVDRGVLELVVLKLLDALQADWGPNAEWTLHLEQVLDRRAGDLERLLEAETWLVVTVALDFDARRDSVRVALPATLIDRLPPRGEHAGASDVELYLRYRDLVAHAPVTLRAVVGRARLAAGELAQLQPGDIMVPEELSLELLPEGGIGGRVVFEPVVAAGRRPRIEGRLAAFTAVAVQVEVDTIELAPAQPGADRAAGGRMSGAHEPASEAGHDEEQIGEGGAVLGEVPLPLVVELGRLQLTLRDLAGLRRGQVLELGRGVEEPVHLVLEGRSIGTGRLVNVEGEIGVQIIDLVR